MVGLSIGKEGRKGDGRKERWRQGEGGREGEKESEREMRETERERQREESRVGQGEIDGGTEGTKFQQLHDYNTSFGFMNFHDAKCRRHVPRSR